MAEIHRTTMTPSKLELLTAWLPHQAWYAGQGEAPRLTRVGGFRLDDPAALSRAIRFATAAGALATTAYGAIPSLPRRDAVDRILADALPGAARPRGRCAEGDDRMDQPREAASHANTDTARS